MKISAQILTGIRAILEARGCTQAWVINRMNTIDPSLEMNRNKLSAIMAKRIVTQEIKDYIQDEIDRRGSVTVDEVAQMFHKLALYDPAAEEARWCRDKARRFMAQRRGADGSRILFAPSNEPARYVSLENSQDLQDVSAVLQQLTTKREGLNAAIARAKRRQQELAGQLTMFETRKGGE